MYLGMCYNSEMSTSGKNQTKLLLIFSTNLTTHSSVFLVLVFLNENQQNDLLLLLPNLNCKISFCSKRFSLYA